MIALSPGTFQAKPPPSSAAIGHQPPDHHGPTLPVVSYPFELSSEPSVAAIAVVGDLVLASVAPCIWVYRAHFNLTMSIYPPAPACPFYPPMRHLQTEPVIKPSYRVLTASALPFVSAFVCPSAVCLVRVYVRNPVRNPDLACQHLNQLAIEPGYPCPERIYLAICVCLCFSICHLPSD